MQKVTFIHPSEIGSFPEFDRYLADIVNERFNGFLIAMANHLGEDIQDYIAHARMILQAAEIKQED